MVASRFGQRVGVGSQRIDMFALSSYMIICAMSADLYVKKYRLTILVPKILKNDGKNAEEHLFLKSPVVIRVFPSNTDRLKKVRL